MQCAMENLFAQTADYYDLDTRFMPGTDIDLYRELLEIQGAPVLELACGTGRISIPLAEAGASVWALDKSPAMLAILKRKRASLPWKVRQRLHPVAGDMARFHFFRRFPLIVIPFRGFQALTDRRRIESCLHHVKRSLAPGGLFVLDLFAPRLGAALTECATDERIDWVYERPETGELITRTSRRRGVDTERRILHTEVAYYVETADGEYLPSTADMTNVQYRLARTWFLWCVRTRKPPAAKTTTPPPPPAAPPPPGSTAAARQHQRRPRH